MSIKIKTASLFLLLFIWSIASCQEKKPNNKLIENRIKSFYKEYINEVSKLHMDLKKIDSLKSDICSEDLYSNIKQLDYDPFLSAQDISNSLLKSLVVKQDSINPYKVYVSYYDDYLRKRKKILLKIVIDDNEIKIDSISNQ